jgi:peptide/nickel transport system substrate-binding protein
MRKYFPVVLVLIIVAGLTPADAATPKDALVMAWQFDDIITLDPAEIFEFSGAEYAGNTYDRLIGYDVDDVSKIYGVVAESWETAADGKTYTFRIREGIKFASGNPLTAEDVAFSLQRTVILDKSPAFILGQFGFTADNVRERIKATGPYTVVLETDKAYAPTFVLYCLTATVGSVVDKKVVMQHEKDGDLGHAWLRTHYAGSGPFKLNNWKPSELLVLDANADYWDGAPKLQRVLIRHIPEQATQRLLVEKGDIDIARNLGPDQIKGLEGNPDVRIHSSPKGGIFYLGLNQKHAALAKPQVRQALKYLVDYDGIAATILKGSMEPHQAFLPKGFLGALEDRPFKLDPDKAKQLLAEAGYPDGLTLSMDTRNNFPTLDMAQAIQSTFALGGVKLEIIPMDGKQALTKYRARNHEIYIGRWGPDYQDPHTNADTFAKNVDNSDDAKAKPLAWRNAWDIPQMSQQTDAAAQESDPAKRAQMYLDIQREHQATSPFVIMFQDIEVAAERSNVKGFVLGPSFDSNFYRHVEK